MSGVHRTVRCNSGATAIQRQRLPATHLMRALRAQKSGVPILAHRTLNSSCLVRHRTSRRAHRSELQRSESNGIGDVAGAPDMSGVHRTVRCTPNSVRCSKEERPPELASLGKTSQLVRYNSPDMSGVHRTVRCNSGATAIQRQRLPATHLMRALRAQKSGVPILAHRTLNSSCPVRHRTSRRAHRSELQRSESNGIGDVAGAPDMSGVHRTVRCAIEQTASTNGQVWWLGL
jgi:hypothetical protein